MLKLKLLILIFIVTLTLPLGYLVLRTYQGLNQEEAGQLRYFADTVFDRMEDELAALVRREEARAIEEYREEAGPDAALVRRPVEEYILGYFQNNPDGSLVRPGAGDRSRPPIAPNQEEPTGPNKTLARLEAANQVFNLRKTDPPESQPARPPDPGPLPAEKEVPAGRYLDVSKLRKSKDYLGQDKKRIQQVTPDQVASLTKQQLAAPSSESSLNDGFVENQPAEAANRSAVRTPPPAAAKRETPARQAPPSLDARAFQAEVDPLQSVFVDRDLVFVFRRIVIGGQIFRQGLAIEVERLMNHLVRVHFRDQPLARFTNLKLALFDRDREITAMMNGVPADQPVVERQRTFPRPFSFLRARISCERIPASPARTTLLIVLTVLGGVILLGLLAIYRSAGALVELSARRAGFVSSVTHELKTPLTNIRLYVEMLQEGLAADPERQEDYLRVIANESARLSRLITNVLEFSRLESRTRPPDLVAGPLDEVLGPVRDVLGETLRVSDFTLRVEGETDRPFRHDREMMIQVLVNLIENGAKFGRGGPIREITVRAAVAGREMRIQVADTGPGIPEPALKKVFEDFYRVDDSLTRKTGGTGLGLALVKRYVAAMGGRVTVANNPGPGCTFTVILPLA